MRLNKLKIKNKIFIIMGYTIFVAYAVYILVQQQVQLSLLNTQNTALAQKIEAEYQSAQKLAQEKKQVDTDQYIEKIAREKLGLIKSDEKVFVDSSRKN